MEHPYRLKFALVGGFIALSVLSFSFTFYEIVYIKPITDKLTNETGPNSFNIVENNKTELFASRSFGNNLYKLPIKHKCYHLNWNESAITQAVFSKCGFIRIGRTRGRSGNQMFQIAALFGTANKLDMIPVIYPTFPLLKLYNLPNVMNIPLINLHQCSEGKGIRDYHECYPEQTNVINITLSGFRQSWKYFNFIEGDIKKIFSQNFKTDSLSKATDFIRSVSNSSYQHVGIHIRRTDVHRNRVKSKDRTTAGVDYFDRAMSFFKIFYKRVHFIILSDDIRWAKHNLRSDDIFYSPFRSPANDLALMSLCDHMIVTYGTFGWWGAWLANGTTLFFSEDDSKRIKITPTDDSDYLIKGSIGIP